MGGKHPAATRLGSLLLGNFVAVKEKKKISLVVSLELRLLLESKKTSNDKVGCSNRSAWFGGEFFRRSKKGHQNVGLGRCAAGYCTLIILLSSSLYASSWYHHNF